MDNDIKNRTSFQPLKTDRKKKTSSAKLSWDRSRTLSTKKKSQSIQHAAATTRVSSGKTSPLGVRKTALSAAFIVTFAAQLGQINYRASVATLHLRAPRPAVWEKASSVV